MPKLTAKTIIAILKDHDVEIDKKHLDDIQEEISDQITAAFDDQAVGDDEMIIKNDKYQGIKDDLTKVRKRMHTAEERVEELEAADAAGQSSLKTENKKLIEKIERLEPLQGKLLKRERARFEKIAPGVSEAIQKKLHWNAPEGDDPTDEDVVKALGKLTDDQVLENLARISEWADLGVEGVGIEAPGKDDDGDKEPPPNLSKSGGKFQKGQGSLDGKSDSALLEEGYKAGPSKKGA